MPTDRYRDRTEAIAATQRAAEAGEDRQVLWACLSVCGFGAVVILALWVWL